MIKKLNIRRVAANDLHLFYDWANDELTRKMSLNSEKISLEAHTKWFNTQLLDKNNTLLVVEIEENLKFKPIGQVNFDKDGIIGISLDNKYRGKGYGLNVIEEGLNYIKKNSDFVKIIAFIKSKNKGSISIFEKAGFIKSDELCINKAECFKYICTIN